jgi:hypothetical protein
MSEDAAPEWLKTAEAARYLRASGPSTVHAWMSRGLLQPDGRVGIGGSWLFKRSTLDRFVEKCAGKRAPATRSDDVRDTPDTDGGEADGA